MSNRIKLLGLAAIGALTAAIVWNSVSGPSLPAPSADPSASRPSPTAALPAEPTTASYLDQVLGGTAPGSPTGDRAQSKLWIAAGAWWAAMVDPKSLQYHIFELVDGGKSWRDTGTLIDERRSAQPDCLWDGSHLYIVSAAPDQDRVGRGPAHPLQLRREEPPVHPRPELPDPDHRDRGRLDGPRPGQHGRAVDDLRRRRRPGHRQPDARRRPPLGQPVRPARGRQPGDRRRRRQRRRLRPRADRRDVGQPVRRGVLPGQPSGWRSGRCLGGARDRHPGPRHGQ